MPSKIDHSLLPPVIRESVDPEILNRAQSIEWSIDRTSGQNERGFVDGSHEDYLSSQNLMHKTHQLPKAQKGSGKQINWLDQDMAYGGRDSGFDYTPTSPSLTGSRLAGAQSARSYSSLSESAGADLSPLDESLGEFTAVRTSRNSGSMKKHPRGQYPFPIYQVNQEQLKGDVVFEVAPTAKPGERTVHYEKSSRILNEQEMDALGLDPKLFGPNSKTTMNELEEEQIETSVLDPNSHDFEDIYNSVLRSDVGQYFERKRARSVSPSGNRSEHQDNEYKRTVIFGSVDEIDNREQEFYPFRDAHQGKPLPGENEYGTWGSRHVDQRQWKLCNGQWVRVAEPKSKPPPKMEQCMAERIKCKPPKKIQVARAEPVRQLAPQSGSTDSDGDTDLDSNDVDASPSAVDSSNFSSPLFAPVDRSSPPLVDSSLARKPPLDLDEQPLETLKDRYRPKRAEKPHENDDAKLNSKPTGTILLEPIRPPTPPLEEIKVEPKQHTYVRMKKPLKAEGEEEKMMEDPNLLWMGMGPAQFGPPFGSLRRRKKAEEEWIGPPCELCHKQIEERRCMLAENMKFHCWHFACSFCMKTLKPNDFLVNQAERKPYCLNCHKREFPEISLTNLKFEVEE